MESYSSHTDQPPVPPPPLSPPPPPPPLLSTMSSSSSSSSSSPPPPDTTPPAQGIHEDAETRRNVEVRLCNIGLLIAHHGWTCSKDKSVAGLVSKMEQYRILHSMKQTFPGYNLKVNFNDNSICTKCIEYFGRRRSAMLCCHPKHNDKYSGKYVKYITAEQYFTQYKEIGLLPNQAICKDAKFCHGYAEEIQEQESEDPFEEPVTKKKLVDTLTNIKQTISPSSPAITFNRRNLIQQGNLVTRELEQVAKTITTGFKEVGLPIEEEDKQQLLQDSEDLNIKKTKDFFDVGQRLVQGSRKRRTETNTILPPVKPKCGFKITDETKSRIKDFYYQDDVSRAYPGKQDFLSIKNKETGKREHKQKRYLLSNLRELYEIFKTHHPDSKIGKSSFMMLRPPECISLTSKGYHNVCVCIHHENVKLLFHAIKISSIKPLISQLVCENGGKDCYYRRCAQCKGSTTRFKTTLRENEVLKNNESISYRRWLTTDGTQYVTQEKDTEEFLDFATLELEKMMKHHYISKAQHEFLVDLRQNLKPGEIVIWGDFSENYSPVIQNAVQSEYFSHKQITLHPFTIYWNVNQEVKMKSITVISDCTTHDTNSFYAFQTKLVPKLVAEFAAAQIKITKIYYVSDGSAAQYKNRKNFCNLYHHLKDFGIIAEWNYGATAHMKGPQDAQGGIAKRRARTASLQGTKITTALEFYNWCSSNIKGIEYIFISDSEIQEIIDEKDLTSRYETIKTIAGTQQAHRIEIASGKIHLYEVSRDTTVMATKIMESEGQPPLVIIDECSVSDWVVCVYEKQWYVAIIDEVDLAEQEVKVTFWKPNTSKSKSGTSYISENASCYIKIGQIIKKIFPSRASRRGRTINISMEEQEEIGRLFQQFQR
ncbi:hypothetical protein Fcan01_19102 [Folsomia candida]|uniref:Uncharacterized protein n=1 Tax=Folsomia candida TaxID=158441 RepID=A0A226DMP5_FOLCA|nr:hypothetical protein Fcan01_19102 [Folsomia candida]